MKHDSPFDDADEEFAELEEVTPSTPKPSRPKRPVQLRDSDEEYAELEEEVPARRPQYRMSIFLKIKLFLLLGVCGLIGLFVVVGAIMSVFDDGKRPQDGVVDARDNDLFEVADRKISVSHGTVGFGNNQQAIAMADVFSVRVAAMRDIAISQRKKKAKFSFSGGKFLTYCHLTDDACVFLVHVPDLRKFDDEAKTFMGDIAYETAQSVVKLTDLPQKPKRIAVGVRGAFLYDRVLIGPFNTSGEVGDSQVEERRLGNDSKNLLKPFFVAKVEPTTVETTEPAVPAADAAPESTADTPTPTDPEPTKTDETTPKPEASPSPAP